jgi:hypothetical protein
VTIGCKSFHDTQAPLAAMSYDIGGTAASDNNRIFMTQQATSGGDGEADVTRKRRKTGIAAATALVAKYKIAPGGTGFFQHRWWRFFRSDSTDRCPNPLHSPPPTPEPRARFAPYFG